MFYVIGLVTTVYVMYAFEAAQPALLYLVPACLVSSMGFAVLRGEFRALWGFTEADPNAKPADAAAAAAAAATGAAAPAGVKKDN